MLDGAPETNFWYKVFVDALFHPEVMSVFNLLIDNWYFTLQHLSNVFCNTNLLTFVTIDVNTYMHLQATVCM